MEHRISKSSYLSGMQCSKRLWCERLQPELVSPPTADQRQRLDQGHEVGELAQRLFPTGLLIEGELEFESHLRKSREALQLRIPLFEPALAIEGAYARADILNPVGNRGWELIEVKSSSNVWEDKNKTKFKQVYLNDIAFQLYVLQQAGIEIERCVLLAINSDYVRRGAITPADFFRTHDVTEQVRAMQEAVPNEIRKYLAVLSASTAPDIEIGAHCEKPYPCGVISHCWREVPANSVHSLYRIGAKADDLWKRGIKTICGLPADFKLTARQQIQVNQERAKKPLIDRAAIGKFLEGLVFPVSFLDFEAFQLAVPPYDGCRPYTQIPFQYSLHVMAAP